LAVFVYLSYFYHPQRETNLKSLIANCASLRRCIEFVEGYRTCFHPVVGFVNELNDLSLKTKQLEQIYKHPKENNLNEENEMNWIFKTKDEFQSNSLEIKRIVSLIKALLDTKQTPEFYLKSKKPLFLADDDLLIVETLRRLVNDCLEILNDVSNRLISLRSDVLTGKATRRAEDGLHKLIGCVEIYICMIEFFDSMFRLLWLGEKLIGGLDILTLLNKCENMCLKKIAKKTQDNQHRAAIEIFIPFLESNKPLKQFIQKIELMK